MSQNGIEQLLACFAAGARGRLGLKQPQFFEVQVELLKAGSAPLTWVVRPQLEVECKVKPRQSINSMVLTQTHPLLLEYNQPWEEIFFRGRSFDTKGFVRDAGEQLAAIMEGWRGGRHYLNALAIEAGYGMLARAPASLIKAIIAVGKRYGLEMQVLPLLGKKQDPERLQLLLMDRYYAIAESFDASLL